jgi:hypothetical protein
MAARTHGWFAVTRGIVANLKQSPLFNAGLVWSAFLVSRCLYLFVQLVLLPTSGDCDVRIYARYAAAFERASAEGGSVYDHCRPEYPHLALVVMALPRAGMIDIPPEPLANPEGLTRYRGLFRVEMAIFDVVAFLTVLWLVHTRFRAEPLWRRTKRLLLFVAGGLLLPTLFYTRLDVVLGALVLLSLALLVSRRHYAWSFAVLAAAVNFKLVPVVLVPLWVVASLPPALVGSARTRGGVARLLAVGGWRCVVAVVLIVACAVPAYLSSDGRSLGFLDYHKDRGLEIGSFYSSALLLLKPFGYPCDFGFGHGSLNVDAPGAAVLARLSPYVTLGLVLAATFVSCRLVLRRKYEESQAGLASVSPNAGDLACGACLVLGAFIAGNKVFSPQYLLWLAPLVPLLPLRSLLRRPCVAAFAAACVLSTATMIVWQHHVVGDDDWIDTVTSVAGPTALGSALLIARNAAFLGLIVLLGMGVAGRGRVRSLGRWPLLTRLRAKRPARPAIDPVPGAR